MYVSCNLFSISLVDKKSVTETQLFDPSSGEREALPHREVLRKVFSKCANCRVYKYKSESQSSHLSMPPSRQMELPFARLFSGITKNERFRYGYFKCFRENEQVCYNYQQCSTYLQRNVDKIIRSQKTCKYIIM